MARKKIAPENGLTHVFRIGLRADVKDFISGASGIVIAQYQYITGCDQYCVAPQTVKDGAPADSFTIPLDRILESVNVKFMEEEVEFQHALGDHVKDCVTGLAGYIVCRAHVLGGFNRYSIVENITKSKDRKADWSTFDEHQLVSTETKKVQLPKTDKPGGPGCEPTRTFG